MEPWQRTKAATKIWSSAASWASGGSSKRPSMATSWSMSRMRSISNGAPAVSLVSACQSFVDIYCSCYTPQYLISSISILIILNYTVSPTIQATCVETRHDKKKPRRSQRPQIRKRRNAGGSVQERPTRPPVAAEPGVSRQQDEYNNSGHHKNPDLSIPFPG